MSRLSAQTPDGDASLVVVAQNLTKVFKDFWLRDRARAVDGVSFEVRRGEIFGLLGPNGSGKSTTIKLMLGLLKKSKGRLAVFGKAPSDVEVKRRIGYLPEESYLYPFLNARETLDYYAKLFGLDHRTRVKRIDELLDMVGLAGVQNRQVREYSKGMQRRIGIAQALINDPEFLILDEPTTGLDPIGNRQVKDLILHLGERGKTILLSSHLLADVEDCVHRMVILYGGKIRAEGTCAELLEARERSIIETDALDEATIEEIRGVLQRRSRRLASVSRPRQRLEDLFIGIVERARADQVATSGAQSGGQTAAFLRGEAAERQGADLIERLVTSEPAASVRPMPTASKPAGPDAGMIDQLMKAGSLPDADSSKPRPPVSAEPDRDLISGLLSGQRDEQSPSSGKGTGG